jgi:hypothetical protein
MEEAVISDIQMLAHFTLSDLISEGAIIDNRRTDWHEQR